MKKAWNIVVSEIKNSHGVLEVLDARCPNDTRCKKLEILVEKFKKPYWIVINKADLVPKNFMERVKNALRKDSNAVDVIFTSTKKYYGYNILFRSIKEFLGKERPKKLCVIGFPNVGKSSLINALAKRVRAKTSSRPGYTKGKQWVKASSWLRIADTPGVIPKEFASKEMRKILFPRDIEESALILIKKVSEAENHNFDLIYGVEPIPKEETLEKIGKKFNFLKSGGEVDITRASKKILDDWNVGKLKAWWF